MNGFVNGINLGGWLSQYGDKSHAHFATFITERDIAQIASWGLDHVRLPVDYPVIESDDAPGVPLEQGYGYIDSCLEWCDRHGLSVVLDIHEAPGFTFTNDLEAETKDRNTLFGDLEVQDRFVALWVTLARRYAQAPVPIIFELLNEVTLPTNDKWNQLAARTHTAIRAIAPTTPIMIGGTHNNGVSGLEGLVVIDDPATVYTFHTYEPLLFTHQNAHWDFATRTWAGAPSYPGELPDLAAFLAGYPAFEPNFGELVGRHLDRDYLESVIAPALVFARATDKPLYCGEFGVADWVEPASRRRWLADLVGILRKNAIGTALWTYKEMDFGIVDGNGAVRDQLYLDILIGQRAR